MFLYKEIQTLHGLIVNLLPNHTRHFATQNALRSFFHYKIKTPKFYFIDFLYRYPILYFENIKYNYLFLINSYIIGNSTLTTNLILEYMAPTQASFV